MGAEVLIDVEGFVAVWADGVVIVDGDVGEFVVFEEEVGVEFVVGAEVCVYGDVVGGCPGSEVGEELFW